MSLFLLLYVATYVVITAVNAGIVGVDIDAVAAATYVINAAVVTDAAILLLLL